MPDIFYTLLLPVHYFIEPSQRVYWLYLYSALLAAWITLRFSRSTAKEPLIKLICRIFPRDIYLHHSALNDYAFFFCNSLIKSTFIAPLFALTTINLASQTTVILTNSLPRLANCIGSESTPIYGGIIFTLVFGLISDFAIFFVHYLQHRIPWLWEFHKVHHSAKVLTPITVYRMHPVDDILTFSFTAIASGFALGVLKFSFKSNIVVFNLAGTNLLFIIFYMLFYNLRHSHIWLSYGPFFSHIFISPAQHQIHHSSDKKHYDKNMGFMFAFWDKLFGTLYVPKQKELIDFGINEQENKKFDSFWALYLMPFISLACKMRMSYLFSLKRYASIVLFSFIVGSALYFSKPSAIDIQPSTSIFMEDMTWPEVKQAINQGRNQVLIPTGGTEQNGPHLILGKHNYIIQYTASEIAKKLGNTLVAPVIKYVPEGEIEPPQDHMRFSGTLSVSNKLFADLLEASARSLKAHGFKVIAFVGDSGGNQEAQKVVSEKLNALWQTEGVKVIHVSDYYQKNNQLTYLSSEGYSMKQIGSHAGIRDTSELMAVHPEGIRIAHLKDNSESEFLATGADGNASKADKTIGEAMLNLKIQAAVEQITTALNRAQLNEIPSKTEEP